MHDRPSWDDWRDLARRIDAALALLQVQLDVANGTACAEEQAAGNGPCGSCQRCLRAALAEQEAEVTSLRLNFNRLLEGDYRALEPEWQPVFDRVAQAETALAEQETMVMALREVMARALESARYVLESGGAIQLDRERVVRDLENGLTSTADAAARCVERAKAEERERAAQLADNLREQLIREEGHSLEGEGYFLQIAAAIRALK